eukprot:CAMPEP_0113418600 /NCGR_PEP_ID=MMETSP0013_2-20120614/26299_1 /TAXON_ID=2843 ORGANISM="Skeletonema costatum, Strain 1716" /NCGR_SAMPLE_ID=MMETSP0013_2 /ASSEMBLY_ACC=CAM_ASM_000158 /LENGTH=516 /DNA_ID=CAMNT_0000305859 /DNA_START=184 /DNA_END=1731 /DNA_ORIENTATION=+ /assembly_acc=CAM_ASM_000158
MEHRDCNYYDAHAADVNLEEITSSAQNAKNLQRLRDGDPTLSHLMLGRGAWGGYSYFGVGDDFGWLGYFIGRSQCLRELRIYCLPEGNEGHAFMEGIARNQSIREIFVCNYLTNCSVGFTSIMRVLHSLPQLEGLDIQDSRRFGPDGWSELRTLLESGVYKLQQLRLSGNYYIGDPGVGILSNRLRGIGSSLKVLALRSNFIGNDGLLAVVEALANCSSLEKLDLSRNDFSFAEAGLGSLSGWLQRDEVNLKSLHLQCCRINDEGLRVVAQGVANHCEELDLDENRTFAATGLSYLSNTIRSDSCRVKTLHLELIPIIANDWLEVLARGLADNKSVRLLYLDDSDLDNDITVASAGWIAFSTALCDTCSVNSTYLSNRTIIDICQKEDEAIARPRENTLRRDISQYLRLNREHPQYAARCKILMNHPHLDMEPLLYWGLKFLPLAVAWFEISKVCTKLTIYDEDLDSRRLVLEESDGTFQSRELTAMYEFIRGMPTEAMKRRKELIVAAHDGNDEI